MHITRNNSIFNSKSVRCTCKQLKPYGRYNNNMYYKVECKTGMPQTDSRIKMNDCGVEQPPNLDLGSEVVSL